ncbi:MAG TPA: GAF and ANTAR domain-containing protein [Jatrophihabitans sp.]|nr:GAF and ANTAR domain-containing protein [Jatrophihabitans sp.]
MSREDRPELTAADGAAREARSSRGQPLVAELAREFSKIARALQAEPDPPQVLQSIVDAAVTEVPGARYAGVSLIQRGGRTSTEAQTHPLVDRVDQAQYANGDGPCMTALREHVTVHSADLRHEPRWPNFATAAVEMGVLSMLSVQLFVRAENLGALNLYAEQPDAFDDDDETIALLLASHAAVALAQARKIENLTIALHARDAIGQAKGILMERFKIDADQAFQILIAISQHQHRKLRDVAADLAQTGEVPLEGS